MKVIHVSPWYFPDTSGGVEVYIESLIKNLQELGVTSSVLAARNSSEPANYIHEGIEVTRYPLFFDQATPAQLLQYTLPEGFEYFANWLIEQKCDIYHQHGWRFGCGWQNLLLARRLGLPTVVTLHLSEAVCLRGTLMLNGESACDGSIEAKRCGRCIGLPAKMPDWGIETAARLPTFMASALEAKLLESKSVRMRQLGRGIGYPVKVKQHRHKLLEMAKLANKVVAVCQWLYDALLLNGIPKEKLILCRQGVSEDIDVIRPLTIEKEQKRLRVVYLGRWHDTKGAEILVRAMQKIPVEVPIQLTIYGMIQGENDRISKARAVKVAHQDTRITFAKPLSRREISSALTNFDLLAVPSQCLETGPLVVLEAFKCGLPVLGSNLGGIAELVEHGFNGWLVSASNLDAWASALIQFATKPEILKQLQKNIQPVRTMQQVAIEMKSLYEQIVIK